MTAMVRATQSAAILRVIRVITISHELLTSTWVMIGNGGFGATACGPLADIPGCFEHWCPEVISVCLPVASLAGTAALPFRLSKVFLA